MLELRKKKPCLNELEKRRLDVQSAKWLNIGSTCEQEAAQKISTKKGSMKELNSLFRQSKFTLIE